MPQPIFKTRVINDLVKQHQPTFNRLIKLEEALNKRFYDMEDPVRLLILSVASSEPLLFVGPPGTAKSRLIRVFCEYLGFSTVGEKDPRYFEYLLTPFTEPSELFGYYDIARAQEGDLVRNDENMMQKAQIVYLDEVFNGSSAILNSILAFMNERVFHDRGQVTQVEMRSLFGSTNDIPRTAELRAVYDRFLLRCQIDNVSREPRPERLHRLFSKGWVETYNRPERAFGSNGHQRKTPTKPAERDMVYPGLLEDLYNLRNAIREKTRQGDLLPNASAGFYQRLSKAVDAIRRNDYSDMSNRRLIKLLHVMLVHRMYREAIDRQREGRSTGHDLDFGQEELRLLWFALDDWNETTKTVFSQAGVRI